MPNSPTPVTGYVIQVPCQDVIELNLTIDEALRFTIIGGVIALAQKRLNIYRRGRRKLNQR